VTAVTRLALVIALAVLALGAFLVVRGDKSSVVDHSISKLNDNERFTTSARAAQTVADVSTDLRLAGASCRKRDKASPRCTVMLQAAAYSAVTAYTLADCTSPGVFDGRKVMRTYLHAVKKYLQHGGKTPSVPKVITC
jgi:hypothetical protein